jgi:hypothetical protein
VGHIIGNRNKDASPELSLSILASCPTC